MWRVENLKAQKENPQSKDENKQQTQLTLWLQIWDSNPG